MSPFQDPHYQRHVVGERQAALRRSARDARRYRDHRRAARAGRRRSR